MLRRKIAAELEHWLKSAEQKALFITGSRQIGKSYSIRAFGKANHATYIELNLMENRQAKDALLEARDADARLLLCPISRNAAEKLHGLPRARIEIAQVPDASGVMDAMARQIGSF